MVAQTLKRSLSYLILGQKGGQNRVEIINLLKERPYNINQLAEILNLNYRTIKHHVDVLLKHELVTTSKSGGYGEVYFLTPLMEESLPLLEEILKKSTTIISSPKFFQRLLEQTNDAVLITNKDDEIIFWNGSAERLFGYAEDEVLGGALPIFEEPDFYRKMQKSLFGKKAVPAQEAKGKHKSGKKMDLEVTMDAIKDDNDDVIGFYIIALDITARKEAEKEIEHMASFPKLNPNPILEVDSSGKIVYHNDAAAKTLKRLNAKADMALFLPPEIETILKELSGGKKTVMSREVKIKDAVFFETVHLNRKLGTVRFYVVDITEWKKMEEQHATIVETALDGFWITDLNGRFIEVNDAYCKMTGYRKSEMLTMSVKDIEAAEKPEETAAHIEKVVKQGYDRFETRHRRKDGRTIDMEISVQFININGGQLVVFARDITERKRIEEVYKAHARLLQFSNEHSLDELLEETLNELENLTGSLIGFFHFMDEDQKTLTLQNWSTRTKREFCRAEGKGMHYGLEKAGVWVDCVHERKPVIHNDYASLPHKKGLPKGHAPVIRELVVPVSKDGKIMAILGVGNKSSNYDDDEAKIVSLLANLAWAIAERKRTEEEKEKISLDFRKRIKELTCLYSLAEIVEKPDIALEEIFKEVTDILPAGWQHPEITCARILFKDKEFRTGNFRITEWKQSADINQYGERSGAAEVYYLEKKPESFEGPFLEEERKLINAVAERLGKIAERTKAEEALREEKGNLEVRIKERTKELEQEKLRQMSAYNRYLIEASLDPLVAIGPDGKIMDVNHATEEAIGRSRSELLGTDFSDYFTEPERVREGYRLAYDTGFVRDYELSIKHKDGHITRVRYNASIYRDEAGKVMGFFASARSI